MIYVDSEKILLRLKIEDEDAIDILKEIQTILKDGEYEVPALASLKFALIEAMKNAGKGGAVP